MDSLIAIQRIIKEVSIDANAEPKKDYKAEQKLLTIDYKLEVQQ